MSNLIPNEDLLNWLLNEPYSHFKRRGADDYRDPQEKNPGLSLSPKGFYDHKTGQSGSLWTLAQEHGFDRNQHTRQTARKPTTETKQKPNKAPMVWGKSVRIQPKTPEHAACVQYFSEHRGIPESSYADLLSLGLIRWNEHRGERVLIYPAQDWDGLRELLNGSPGTVKRLQRIFLNPDNSKVTKRHLGSAGDCAFAFILPPLSGNRQSRKALVVEGPEDGLSLRGLHPDHWIFVSSDKGSLKHSAPLLEKFDDVLVIADNDPDEGGQQAAWNLGQKLQEMKIPKVEVLMPPEQKDDANAALNAGRLETWLESLVEVSEEFRTALADPELPDRQREQLQKPTWGEPQPLPTVPEPPPTPPDAAFPEPFRAWVFDLAERLCVPREMPFVALLVAMASAIGTQLAVRPKQNDFGWLIVPVLWGMVVALPGRKKSPATTPAFQFSQQLERELQALWKPEHEKFAADQEYYQIKVKASKGRIEAALRKGNHGEADDLRAELEQFQTPEDPPPEPRLLTSDATPPKLVRFCRENPEGICLQVDELPAVFRACEKQGNEEMRTLLLTGYDGDKSYSLDRKGEGLSDHAENLAISLFGTIQPGPLAKEVRKAIESPDGLLPRFGLAVFPAEVPFRQVDRPQNHHAQGVLRGLFQKLRPLDWQALGATRGGFDRFPHLGFDSEAQALFNQWQAELYNERLTDPDSSDVLKTHLAKHEKVVCLLALLFHVAAVLTGSRQAGPITADSFRLAAAWSQILQGHAQRIYDSAGSGAVEGAQVLGNRIKAGRLEDGFTARDVQRKRWSHLTTLPDINEALETLESRNWIRAKVADRKGVPGRPPAVQWKIKPNLKGQND